MISLNRHDLNEYGALPIGSYLIIFKFQIIINTFTINYDQQHLTDLYTVLRYHEIRTLILIYNSLNLKKMWISRFSILTSSYFNTALSQSARNATSDVLNLVPLCKFQIIIIIHFFRNCCLHSQRTRKYLHSGTKSSGWLRY